MPPKLSLLYFYFTPTHPTMEIVKIFSHTTNSDCDTILKHLLLSQTLTKNLSSTQFGSSLSFLFFSEKIKSLSVPLQNSTTNPPPPLSQKNYHVIHNNSLTGHSSNISTHIPEPTETTFYQTFSTTPFLSQTLPHIITKHV